MLKAPIVRWLGTVLLASLVLDTAHGELGIAWGKARVHPTRILARYKSPETAAAPQAVNLLSSLGLAVQQHYPLVPGLVSIDAQDSALSRAAASLGDEDLQRQVLAERIVQLRRSGLFAYVEPNYVRHLLAEPTDARYVDGTLWGLRNDGDFGGIVGADISAREAWDYTTGSTNVIVAVIDTGVRYTHVELAPQMWYNPKESGPTAVAGVDDDGNGVVDDIHGINAESAPAVTGDPMDINGHGSHVSGTIGAAANDGNPHVGIAWKVRIMACKFLGPQGGYAEGAVACITYATTNGAKIMNNSWGGGPPSTAEKDAIAAALKAGVLFVAAAGNDAKNTDTDDNYPSNYDVDNVISVAAVTRADQLASFSNYGLLTVDLGAPGEEIFSCLAISDTSYGVEAGTSMAAPHVTGVAALIRAVYPTISVYELKDRLMQTVVKIPALEGLTVTGGRVNAAKALAAVGDGDMELGIVPPAESVLLIGSNQVVNVTVTDAFGITNATITTRFVQGTSLAGPTLLDNGTGDDTLAGDATYSGSFRVPNASAGEITLELVVSAPAKNTSTNRVHWYVTPPPPNDNFVNASKISADGGLILANSQYATFEQGEPLHAGVALVDSTLWWAWSPDVDSRVLVDTAGSLFDTVVAVYTGTSLSTLREVASADEGGPRDQAYVQFDATAGTTYFIAVGGANAEARGSIRMRLELGGIPDILPPIVDFVSPPSGFITSSNRISITGVAGDPRAAGDLRSGSGVQQVFVKTVSDLVPKVAVGSTNWTVSLLLTPGYNTIQAFGSDFARNVSEPVLMTVQYVPTTVGNDHYVNALPLTGTNAAGDTITGDTRLATREAGEPRHAGNQGGHSVWYQWVAPQDGALSLSTSGDGATAFDTLLAAYTGTRLTNLVASASNDDVVAGGKFSGVDFGVRQGVTYYIAVDGFAGGSGIFRLTYRFTPGTIQKLVLSAGAGGRTRPAAGLHEYANGTVVEVTALPLAGYRFAGWEGTTNSSANPLSLTMSQDFTLKALFQLPQITDDFERGRFNPDLTYGSQPGMKPWTVQSVHAAGGQYAARSSVLANNEASSLTLTAATESGLGSFTFRVSSEPSWDQLQFYINGELNKSWSGTNDVVTSWSTYQFPLARGTNVIEWRYVKDITLSAGEDAAYIDDILLPAALPPVEEEGLSLAMVPGVDGFKLRLAGQAGRLYRIEYSTDLRHWNTLQTVTATAGVIEVTDPATVAPGGRFYRAIEP